MAYEWMQPMSPAELAQEAADYEFNAQYDQYDGLRADAREDARHDAAMLAHEEKEIIAGRLCGGCRGYICDYGVIGCPPPSSPIRAAVEFDDLPF